MCPASCCWKFLIVEVLSTSPAWTLQGWQSLDSESFVYFQLQISQSKAARRKERNKEAARKSNEAKKTFRDNLQKVNEDEVFVSYRHGTGPIITDIR